MSNTMVMSLVRSSLRTWATDTRIAEDSRKEALPTEASLIWSSGPRSCPSSIFKLTTNLPTTRRKYRESKLESHSPKKGGLLQTAWGCRQFWTVSTTFRSLRRVTTTPEGRYFLKATADKFHILIALVYSPRPLSKTRRETTSWSKRWGRSSSTKWESSRPNSSSTTSNTKQAESTFAYIRAWGICIHFRMGSHLTEIMSSSKSNMNMIRSLASQ